MAKPNQEPTPEPRKREDTAVFLRVARSFYGNRLEVDNERDITKSMQDWMTLRPGEQRFIQAHLLYMGLVGLNSLRNEMHSGREELAGLRDRLETELDEIGRALEMAASASMAGEEEEEDEPAPAVAGAEGEEPEPAGDEEDEPESAELAGEEGEVDEPEGDDDSEADDDADSEDPGEDDSEDPSDDGSDDDGEE